MHVSIPVIAKSREHRGRPVWWAALGPDPELSTRLMIPWIWKQLKEPEIFFEEARF